ncbi:MAG: winged helix-turn-helix transcriptional regulator [Nitrospiraceae bacterium]|nr:winged helix-turn-helix transcriptional regulator [Nitrospiraceae bacterium]
MKSKTTGTVLTSGQCAAVLKAIGDETRLQILEYLLINDHCVTELMLKLSCAQPHVSHHLRILRHAGLVEGIREGKRVCYRITPGMKRALANGQGQSLDFGCCEVRFPASTLSNLQRGK